MHSSDATTGADERPELQPAPVPRQRGDHRDPQRGHDERPAEDAQEPSDPVEPRRADLRHPRQPPVVDGLHGRTRPIDGDDDRQHAGDAEQHQPGDERVEAALEHRAYPIAGRLDRTNGARVTER